MTNEENKEWFEAVKGRPIRWSSWKENNYTYDQAIIPIKLGNNGFFESLPVKTIGNSNRTEWSIRNGFNEDSHDGHYWYFDKFDLTKLGKLYYANK